MARMARVVVPGIAHHITQRGNHGEDVFFDDQDRLLYLALLADNAQRFGMRILGYCLMTNHVHVVGVPEREDSLANAFGRTHNNYARWQHIRQRQTGHLWQNRFFSCPLDAGHCWAALRYVECNPVRAQLISHASDWRWSSALAHTTGKDATGLLDIAPWRACWTPKTWNQTLERGADEALFKERLRQATNTGRPLGGAGFAEALGEIVGHPLLPQKRGRKPRALTLAAAQ